MTPQLLRTQLTDEQKLGESAREHGSMEPRLALDM